MTRAAHKISSAVAWFYDHAPEGWTIEFTRHEIYTDVYVSTDARGRCRRLYRRIQGWELASLNITDVVADLVAALRDTRETRS